MNPDFVSNRLIQTVEKWIQESKQVGMAVLVSATGSSPMPLGSIMVINSDSESLGSVSGGCVEPAVIGEVLRRLDQVSNNKSGTPYIGTFSYTDEEAFNFGLTCGGSANISAFMPDWNDFLPLLKDSLKASRSYIAIDISTGAIYGLFEIDSETKSVVCHGQVKNQTGGIDDLFKSVLTGYRDKNISSGFFHVTVGSFGSDDITFLRHDMNAEVGGNKNDGHFDLNVANEYDMFFYRYIGTHRLIIAGVSDHAVALSEIGLKMGYRVVVVDPRPMFLNESRFNKEIELELKWPEDYISEIRDTVSEKDSLCMLSHDEKFDIPALKLAVDLPFGYIGAIGSRVTAEKRFQKLKDLEL